jgi:hypothetical protein
MSIHPVIELDKEFLNIFFKMILKFMQFPRPALPLPKSIPAAPDVWYAQIDFILIFFFAYGDIAAHYQ